MHGTELKYIFCYSNDAARFNGDARRWRAADRGGGKRRRGHGFVPSVLRPHARSVGGPGVTA